MDSYMINKDISRHIYSRSKLVQTFIRHSHPIWPLYPSQLFSLLWNQPAFLYLSFYKTSPSRGRIRSDLEKKRFSCSAASQTHWRKNSIVERHSILISKVFEKFLWSFSRSEKNWEKRSRVRKQKTFVVHQIFMASRESVLCGTFLLLHWLTN